MLLPHFFVRERLLRIARLMRRDLRGASPAHACLLHVLLDLLPPWTRRLQILPRVTLDLRLSMLAALDLVTELLQPRRKLRTINRRRILLRLVKLLRLQRPRLAVRRLGHIEDHRVRVQLRRGVAVHGPAAVVLELGHGPLRPSSAPGRCRPCAPARTSPSHRAPCARSPGGPLSRGRRRQPSAVSETDFGALNVASHPARCSIVRTVSPWAFTYSRAV